MNTQMKAKVIRTRAELDNVDNMHPDTREGLHALLDSAEMAANGISDTERVRSLADAILSLSIVEIRKNIQAEEHMREYVSASVASHVSSCPFGGRKTLWHIVGTRIMPWILCLILGVSLSHTKQITHIVQTIVSMTR